MVERPRALYGVIQLHLNELHRADSGPPCVICFTRFTSKEKVHTTSKTLIMISASITKSKEIDVVILNNYFKFH